MPQGTGGGSEVSNPDQNEEVMDLRTLALAYREAYESYIAADFTPPQALYLTSAMFNGTPGPAPDQGQGASD